MFRMLSNLYCFAGVVIGLLAAGLTSFIYISSPELVNKVVKIDICFAIGVYIAGISSLCMELKARSLEKF
jgi:hypothetical protein